MTIKLTEKQAAAMADLVQSGRYASSDEVLQTALDSLVMMKLDEDAKEAFLIEAIDAGDASGIYEGDVFADIRRELGLSA
jgi:Arc/MetJ-type ribon-helix-helix transcriptional regulator